MLTLERGRTATAREAGEQVDRLSGTQADSQAGREADRHCTGRQGGRQTRIIQADRQSGAKVERANRQTKEKDRHAGRQAGRAGRLVKQTQPELVFQTPQVHLGGLGNLVHVSYVFLPPDDRAGQNVPPDKI